MQHGKERRTGQQTKRCKEHPSLPTSLKMSRPASPHMTVLTLSLLRCLPLLLLFFLTTPSATTVQRDTHLPTINLTDSITATHQIPAATSLHQPLTVPENTSVLVEAFFTATHPYPHPLLLVGTTAPPLVFTPFEAPAGIFGDFEAFWTCRKYAFILLTNLTSLHIRIYEHNDTYRASLNATLRISIVPHNSCPTGPLATPCSARGHCRAGECVCRTGYAGRYCESEIRNLTKSPFDIPSEEMVHHVYTVPRNGSVAVRLQIVHDPTQTPPGQPIMVVKRAYENGAHKLDTGSPLPSVYDKSFYARSGILGHLPVQTIVRANLNRGDRLYIGVYNRQRPIFFIKKQNGFTAGLLASYAPVTVQVEAFPCVSRKVEGVRRCPAAGHETWELSLTFLLLPLLLGTLTLLTMVVCVSVWAGVFRQQIFEVIHGHAPDENLPRRDKLSEAEVNAMFPAFVFTKGETAALGATGDVCCSVCLSSFEEGELLRRLACGHSYHSTCLDRWLLTNATCPRCRKSARIHGEVGRGWLVRRYLLRAVGRICGALQWLSSFVYTRERETPEMESIEVEGLLPNREEGISRRFVQTS